MNKSQLNYDIPKNLNNSMNFSNIMQNFNYNDNNNNKFYPNNNNPNLRNTLNNKGSLSMQGMKNTTPNFNLNESLNFSMIQGNNQQLMNNRNNQRGFYNQQNYLINGNLMNANSLPGSSKTMRNEKIINSFQQKDSKFGNNMQNKKGQKLFNNNNINNNNMNINMNLMSQELKNNNINNNDNRYIFKQQNQNQKNLKNNNIYDPELYQSTEGQLMNNNMQNINNNHNNNYLGNYSKNKYNENIKNNTNSLILRLKIDKEKYENLEINLDEDPLIFYQTLHKKVNMNENLMVFLYKKIKDIMDNIKMIFDKPLKEDSFKDLKTINTILKSKDYKSINGIKLMKIEKNILKRNFSFDTLNLYKHKKFANDFLFSSESTKTKEDLNISH